ncbi:hypothetical protein [Desulfuromonas thiophila]|uniref:Uncharacterized protein n=1 Tax=Desulfuromonas thiophila TaxID=57664 RepID=A0A1G7ETC8_9BACT|nr:hypothetical protein [Desulfuromonas thiophila]SDE66685.1 hypothetical protein SAMN05661003_12311 [Desulfuromonas thiophila]
MKKALFLLLILAFAGTAFAAYSEDATATLGEGDNSLKVKLSNQVKLDYAENGDGDTFVIAAYHDKGTRTFMSSSEDASIYYGEETKITMPDAPDVGTSIGTTDDFDKTL